MIATIDSPSTALTVIGRIGRTLAQSVDLDEIKDIRDQAEAVRHYAKAAACSLEMQNQAAEVKLVAERRGGVVLRELGLHGGDRKSRRNGRPKLGELGISKQDSSRWQREASLPEEDFQEYLRETKLAGKELTSHGLLRLVRIHAEATRAAADRDGFFRRVVDRLRELARQPARFSCIYVTPPWPEGRKAKAKIRDLAESLADLPVKPLAAKRAHLHLWTTPEFMQVGFRLLSAWGFRYKASLVRTKAPSGYGQYWQQAHEVLLLGVRGGLEFRDGALPSWIEGHLSSSADSLREIHGLIERVSPEPYLELFGDKRFPGWTAVPA